MSGVTIGEGSVMEANVTETKDVCHTVWQELQQLKC